MRTKRLAAGLAALALLRRQLRRLALFEESFRQLGRDRECLGGEPPKS
jgi:hypothetical protein